uniref:Uncharacterized protein n=1 Tax=Chrysotila carterae TaxID=13221 RepID=A0A7S4BVN1_CHRCT
MQMVLTWVAPLLCMTSMQPPSVRAGLIRPRFSEPTCHLQLPAISFSGTRTLAASSRGASPLSMRMQLSTTSNPDPEAAIEAVRKDLYRTEMQSSTPAFYEEQLRRILRTAELLTEELEERLPQELATQPISIDAPPPIERAELDRIVGPHLPFLMSGNYPELVRAALQKVRTRTQQRALLALNQYVIGAYEETADAIADMHWKQLNKLRELCDAAQEGGIEMVQETAKLMREDFDTDFCNFLNYEIEQEENRLRDAGLEPAAEAKKWLPLPAAPDADADSSAIKRRADSNAIKRRPAMPSVDVETPAPLKDRIGEQKWLLVLRVVKQGVYTMLAKERQEDIKTIRYLTNMGSAKSRRELTVLTLEQMLPDEIESFKTTVKRVVDNLAVQRDERDAELHAKVSEIKQFIDAEGY